MAVNYDNATSYALPSFAESSSSFSHTVGTGSNRYLLVFMGRGTGFGNTPTSVTYGGVSMALVGTKQNAGSGTETFIYGLAAPASGSNTVSVSWGVATRGGIGAISFDSVDQAAPYGTVVTSTTGSATVTSATDGMVVDGMETENGDTSPITVGGGQTQRLNFVGSAGGGSSSHGIGVSTKPGATSVTMSWTGYFSANQIAVPLNAAASTVYDPITACFPIGYYE